MSIDPDWKEEAERSARYELEHFDIKVTPVSDDWTGDYAVIDYSSNGRQYTRISLNNRAEYDKLVKQLEGLKHYKWSH